MSLFKDINFSFICHNTRTTACEIKNEREFTSLRFSALKKSYSELEREAVTQYFAVQNAVSDVWLMSLTGLKQNYSQRVRDLEHRLSHHPCPR